MDVRLSIRSNSLVAVFTTRKENNVKVGTFISVQYTIPDWWASRMPPSWTLRSPSILGCNWSPMRSLNDLILFSVTAILPKTSTACSLASRDFWFKSIGNQAHIRERTGKSRVYTTQLTISEHVQHLIDLCNSLLFLLVPLYSILISIHGIL